MMWLIYLRFLKVIGLGVQFGVHSMWGCLKYLIQIVDSAPESIENSISRSGD